MALLFYSVVRRHMKETSGFTLCDDINRLMLPLDLTEGESVIGWYRNPAPWEASLLIFTSNAIWIVDGGNAERIPYTDILDYESPLAKEDVTGLQVQTKGGPRFMRVAGSYGPYGKYKDFIGLLMVIRAILNSARE